MICCKNPIKRLRQGARREISEQLDNSGACMTVDAERDEAEYQLQQAQDVLRDALHVAYERFNWAIDAIDPRVKRHIVHDNEETMETFWYVRRW